MAFSLRPILDRFVPATLSLYARSWHRLRCEGSNPLAGHGAAVVAANHPCHVDPALLTAASMRWIHFLQAREEYDVWMFRPFFRLFGCIPVNRDRPDFAALRRARAELRRGAVLGLFPEGDLSPADGTMHPGKPGAALLALRTRAPLVPAYIWGTAPARGSVLDWIRPAPGARVRFGAPIDLSPYADRPISHGVLQEVTELLMQRIKELRPQRADVFVAHRFSANEIPGGTP